MIAPLAPAIPTFMTTLSREGVSEQLNFKASQKMPSRAFSTVLLLAATASSIIAVIPVFQFVGGMALRSINVLFQIESTIRGWRHEDSFGKITRCSKIAVIILGIGGLATGSSVLITASLVSEIALQALDLIHARNLKDDARAGKHRAAIILNSSVLVGMTCAPVMYYVSIIPVAMMAMFCDRKFFAHRTIRTNGYDKAEVCYYGIHSIIGVINMLMILIIDMVFRNHHYFRSIPMGTTAIPIPDLVCEDDPNYTYQYAVLTHNHKKIARLAQVVKNGYCPEELMKIDWSLPLTKESVELYDAIVGAYYRQHYSPPRHTLEILKKAPSHHLYSPEIIEKDLRHRKMVIQMFLAAQFYFANISGISAQQVQSGFSEEDAQFLRLMEIDVEGVWREVQAFTQKILGMRRQCVQKGRGVPLLPNEVATLVASFLQ